MKVGIITGADGGIGKYLTEALAKKGYFVIMACKNKKKGDNVCEQIKQKTGCSSIEVIHLDLSSFDSINQFVTEIYSKYNRIDIILNNAGVLCCRPQTTKENVELTIGVNYLGHYLLTEKLFSLTSEGTRIINTVSLMLRYGKIAPDFLLFDRSHFSRFTYYSHSKLALYYATLEWAEKWKQKGITVNCVDPGIVNTNIIRLGNKVVDKLCDWFFRPLIRTPQQGADTIIYLATNDEVKNITGKLFRNRKIKQMSSSFNNHPQRELLKQQTEDFIARYINV
ncbi:MAG: SDR family oxidoreductase [Bacteroidales bacterium]|jgi:NAD(P)-dependent dehydrogenase (short-subunit alcohol dehydrogenase family)|nr:SDR family oxidoreductase [Bacteroidales bacterium]